MRTSAATVFTVAALFVNSATSSAGLLNAQGVGRTPSRPTSPRDSAALIALLDSLDRADEADDGRAKGVRQTITMQGIARGYRVGNVQVDERSAPLSWRLVSPRISARLSATPVELAVSPTTVRGVAPMRGRLDVMLRPGDTVGVYGRSASSPSMLDAAQTTAIGAVGTSTLDLESMGLGVTAQLGVRGVASFPVGDVVLGVSGAVENEPRPSGAEPVYWRGTSVRGGISLYALNGDARIVSRVELAHSSADSLSGRNLFPGGGSLGVDVSVDGPIGAKAAMFGTVAAFYTRPIGNDRADQPNRLIPIGDYFGVSGAILIPVRSVMITPSLMVSRESSHADALEGLVTTRLDGSGWAVAGGTVVDITLPGGLTLSPEGGVVIGSVGAQWATQITRPRIRGGRTLSSTGFSDQISGWWGGVTLSLAF